MFYVLFVKSNMKLKLQLHGMHKELAERNINLNLLTGKAVHCQYMAHASSYSYIVYNMETLVIVLKQPTQTQLESPE